MGLDQYLYSKRYVQNWDHMGPDDRHTITIQKGSGPVEIVKDASYIIEQVGYWRKANMIQGWFVDHVYGTQDDNGPVSVEREQLQELLGIVRTVMAASELIPDPSADAYAAGVGPDGLPIPPEHKIPKVIKDPRVALDLLPPTSGFFFGSNDLNEWYFNDLVDTEKILTKALALPDDRYFEYEASY